MVTVGGADGRPDGVGYGGDGGGRADLVGGMVVAVVNPIVVDVGMGAIDLKIHFFSKKCFFNKKLELTKVVWSLMAV